MTEMPQTSLPTQQRLNDHLIRWVSVSGYEGRYEVSDDGRVRSLPNRTRRSVRELAQAVDNGGYRIVTLYSSSGRATKLVHRLVASAFCGDPREGDEVCHGNGNRQDNRASNLRWDTRSKNQLDAVRHGTHSMSSRTHCARGHAFTERNTYKRPSGGRYCRECHRLDERERKVRPNVAPHSAETEPASCAVE